MHIRLPRLCSGIFSLIAVAACGATETPGNEARDQRLPHGVTRLANVELFDGLALASGAAVGADGKSPQLHVSCSPNFTASLQFAVANEAGRPPPLRGVFGTVAVDGAAPVRFEAGWSTYGWMPREMPEAEAQRLALAIAGARTVVLRGLEPYAATPVTWTIDLPDDERRRLRSICEQTLKTPSPPAAETPHSRAIKARRLERTRAANERARIVNARRAQVCRNRKEAGSSADCVPPYEMLPEE